MGSTCYKNTQQKPVAPPVAHLAEDIECDRVDISSCRVITFFYENNSNEVRPILFYGGRTRSEGIQNRVRELNVRLGQLFSKVYCWSLYADHQTWYNLA